MSSRTLTSRSAAGGSVGPSAVLLATFRIALVAISMSAFGQIPDSHPTDEERGLLKNLPGAYEGYTIIAPLKSTSTYLIDMNGQIVHEWQSSYTPTFGIYLLANGHLLRAARDPDNLSFDLGGYGGIVQEIGLDGTIAWEYRYSSRQQIQHHDIELLPNGNVILLAWERKNARDALISGRDPEMITGLGLWSEHLVEIRPTRPEGGEIVWEWHVWDHLIQNRDPRVSHYGKVEDHPELVNINGDLGHRRESAEEIARLRALGYIADSNPDQDPRRRSDKQKADWTHANSVSFNPQLDLLALSVLRFDEIWIIDHSTSTSEAAGHNGGKAGRGGDLIFRWGNPQVYRGARFADRQKLFGQHDVSWIRSGFPGAGNLLVFNNGRGRPNGDHSSVDEIRLPRDLTQSAKLKATVNSDDPERVWSFSGSGADRFYSAHISGAQRLANGNTLVCVGEFGRIFEVTSSGRIVWDYLNPFMGDYSGKPSPPWARSTTPASSAEETRYGLARAIRISPAHPGIIKLLRTSKN
jgi:hypothetical protein